MTEPLPADTRTYEQLSVEIARRLFECGLGRVCPHFGHFYASDHNAALGLVVPEMLKRPDVDSFECGVYSDRAWAIFRSRTAWLDETYADTLPRAICLAAEAALDAEEEQR